MIWYWNIWNCLNKSFETCTQIAVQALKLSQLAIERFMSPNLLLLDVNISGTSIELLGPTIMLRLHDVNWEVRDSTLELVTAIATIADVSKYFILPL